MRVHYEVATTCTASADFVQLVFFFVCFFKKPMLLVRFVLENKQYTSEGR